MKFVVFKKTAGKDDREILGQFDNTAEGSAAASRVAERRTKETGGEWMPNSPGTIVGQIGEQEFIAKKLMSSVDTNDTNQKPDQEQLF